ncbi:MAG: porphobilinogen synthase [Nannocystaceae bacterium]
MTALSLRSRPRRNRKDPAIRAFHSETHLGVEHLIYPLFHHEGVDDVPIRSMPGCMRLSPDGLLREVERALEVGVRAVVLFPAIADALKTSDGRESYNPEGLYPRTIAGLKRRWPELLVVTDVALDPYSSDGHDGIVAPDGRILNDETVEVLCRQAVVQAEAGADVIAPSDMMDGRVGAIRDASGGDRQKQGVDRLQVRLGVQAFRRLDSGAPQRRQEGLPDGPGTPRRRSASARPRRAEGDMVVKPAGPYSDVIRRVREAGDAFAGGGVSGERGSTRCSRRRDAGGWRSADHQESRRSGGRGGMILSVLCAAGRRVDAVEPTRRRTWGWYVSVKLEGWVGSVVAEERGSGWWWSAGSERRW